MYDYTILEQSRDEDGGTRGRFIYGPDDKEVRVEVAPGYDLETRIRGFVDDREHEDKWWASLTHEEQRRAVKLSIKRNARFQAMAGEPMTEEWKRALNDELTEEDWQEIYKRCDIEG